MSSFLIAIIIGVIAGAMFFVLTNSARRKYASFSLYKVRDDLVMLLAEGKLKEDSELFRYYYKRTNFILRESPEVGIEHIVESIIKQQGNSDFKSNFAEAKNSAEKMYQAALAEDSEVRDVIAGYYRAQKNMILSHSNLVKIIYVLKLKGWVRKTTNKIFGDGNADALEYVNFASDKADQFSPTGQFSTQ